jgi:hypothetical protein
MRARHAYVGRGLILGSQFARRSITLTAPFFECA